MLHAVPAAGYVAAALDDACIAVLDDDACGVAPDDAYGHALDDACHESDDVDDDEDGALGDVAYEGLADGDGGRDRVRERANQRAVAYVHRRSFDEAAATRHADDGVVPIGDDGGNSRRRGE